MLTLNDGRPELWQWDTGRTLSVDADCSQVHFSNKVFGRSIDVDVIDGVAIIPDILLQTDKDLNVWAFVGTAENGYTKISKTFKVNRRNKPSDYVFTPPEQTSLEEIKKEIEYLKSIQDPDAIKNAVEDYLEHNPPAAYTLPLATETTLGGVKAAAATEEMTQPVGITAEGKLVTAPGQNSGGNVDLTGYATEKYVQEYAQPKGEYLTEVPEGYAKTEDIPTKPEDIGAQPSGNYLTEVPSGYATEEFVKNKIAEAELGGEEVDLSGYAQKSEIPTKVSQLQNDKGYLTEHQDISGKLDASALPTAINTALAQAKASGEFDGKDGKTPVRGTDYWTEADKEEILRSIMLSLSTPVYGRVDEENNIIITAELADGDYTLKYENANGTKTDIGTFTVGGIADESGPIAIDWATGVKLDKNTGAEGSGSQYGASQSIAFDSNYAYTLATSNDYHVSAAICWYDASGGYIGWNDALKSGSSPGTSVSAVLVPMDNAASFRIRAYSIHSTDPDRINSLNGLTLRKDLIL